MQKNPYYIVSKCLGTFEPTTAEDMAGMMYEGVRLYAPIYFKDPQTGLLGIRNSFGLFRVGNYIGKGSEPNKPVLVASPNPNDLEPFVHRNPIFQNDIAPGYWMSNNPDDLRHIKVVEARRQHTAIKWIVAAIHKFSERQNSNKIEYGFLERKLETLWYSKAIAYELQPVSDVNPSGDPDQKLYTLKCYMTAGKGRPFNVLNRSISENIIKGTMKLGAASRLVTMAEADDIVREDFAKRADLVIRTIDPRAMGRIPSEPDMNSRLSPAIPTVSGRLGSRLATIGIRILQGIQAKFNEFNTSNAFFTGAKIFYYIVSEYIIRGMRSAILQIGASVVELTDGALKKPAQPDDNENVAYEFWPKGISHTGTAQYFGLDPEKAKHIAWMAYDDVDVRQKGSELRSSMPDDWPLEFILGVNYCPIGSVFEKRDINGGKFLYITQPNGIEQYSLYGRELTYARYRPDYVYPSVQPLPKPVRAVLSESDFLKVFEDEHGVLQSCLVKEEDVEADIAMELQKPLIKPPQPAAFNRLRHFNEEAAREAAPKTTLDRARAMVREQVSSIRQRIGLEDHSKSRPKTPTEAFLDAGLKDRVPFIPNQVHLSSNTAPASVQLPIAQP